MLPALLEGAAVVGVVFGTNEPDDEAEEDARVYGLVLELEVGAETIEGGAEVG